MSKEELMKIQTCVLKVNIHCDGCKSKVKKILQKIDGVYKTSIDSEQNKVTVCGNVDIDVLIKKLAKSGKHAELWGAPKANYNNQNQLANQFKNMQLNNGKGANNHNNNNKGGQKGGNNNQNNNPKGVGNPTPQQLQQLQQFQQMKALQDLKLNMGQMAPFNQNNNNNQKAVKFDEVDNFSYEYDDDDLDDDYDIDDDELYDELDEPHHPLNKMKAMNGNGPKGMPVPNMMMLNGMMNGNNPQLMNALKGVENGAPNGAGKKGGNGDNAVPVQVHANGGNDGKNGNGGKKGGGGGNNNGGNQNQGGGKNSGKNGGALPQEGKNGNNGGGAANKNGGNNGGANGGNGGKKGNNGAPPNGINGFHNMGGPNGNIGQMANMNMAMGQMGGSLPMRQMGAIPAVQGLPAAAVNGSAGGGGGGGGAYFQGAGPEVMPGNPYHQQQQQQQYQQQQQQYLAAMNMINQQRPMGGNERFQPLMYARPPPAVNYMPPPPYPYPYPPPQPDPYAHFFSDENTSGCNVM